MAGKKKTRTTVKSVKKSGRKKTVHVKAHLRSKPR